MKYIVKNKHWDLVEEYNVDKLLYLSIDRPNKILNDEYFIWENNKGQYHREYDLPTYIFTKTHTHLFWYINGLKHRKNSKPSYIDNNGLKEYWQNGNHIVFNKKYTITELLFNLIDRSDTLNHYNTNYLIELSFKVI